jgi:GNAT superfamily N-acetyltransferase
MSHITITPARLTDADDVIRLFGALHEHNATLDSRFALAEDWQHLVRDYLRQSARSEDSIWLLARDGDRAIGFVLVEVHTDSPLYRHRRWAEIVGLYVEPTFRGANISRRLMEHAYAWAMEHHLSVMQLYVTASNHTARRFYARQGFATSQVIMRRLLTADDLPDDLPLDHEGDRLHFSEGGARPFDMHDHTHRSSGDPT